MVDGISDKQEDSRDELTAEILADEKVEFTRLFSTACDEECD